MSQDTKPAPFNLGDHVRYVAGAKVAQPNGQGNPTELLLVPGMEGVIVLSTGMFSAEGAAAPKPWHCVIQFRNGFHLDINPDNGADFEMVRGSESRTL